MDTAAEEQSKYTSIADCERCRRIPQKVAEDIGGGAPKIIPPEVNELLTVLEVEDESTHRYCSSTTRLLKCPVCGTCYYYNHYDDEGEYFMDPPTDVITLRRYDPLTAIDFLEGVAAGSEGALPNAFGQLTKAFIEGTNVPTTKMAEAGLDAKREAARKELDELRGRRDEIMRDLVDILQHRSLDWQIKMYAIESLCGHFSSQGDWDSLGALLLHHADPVVRVSTAKLVIGIGTGDAPVPDILHATGQVRSFLEAEVAKKARMGELVEILLELALSDNGMTLEYDHGYGSSSYRQRSVRSVALYYLVVAAGRKAEMTHAIPTLLGLLSKDKGLNSEVCWVLRTLAEKKKKSAQAILDELERMGKSRKAEISGDANVKQLVAECEKRVAKKK